jgi:hypothetical protein
VVVVPTQELTNQANQVSQYLGDMDLEKGCVTKMCPYNQAKIPESDGLIAFV